MRHDVLMWARKNGYTTPPPLAPSGLGPDALIEPYGVTAVEIDRRREVGLCLTCGMRPSEGESELCPECRTDSEFEADLAEADSVWRLQHPDWKD